MNILATIVESKKQEIGRLYTSYDLHELSDRVAQSHPVTATTPRFYQALAETRAAGRPFFITEFKRKSPSEGWINRDADLPAQVRAYTQAGAGAISVLTDEPFFGGNYSDLKLAAETLHLLPSAFHRLPLLLQKDFILDPIQIYLAKLHGADIILLIAAILEPERLNFLKKTAESLGMGVLVEVHDAEELAKIQHLDFPVLGVNNRDLKTFGTALNRVNVLRINPTPDPSPNGRGGVERSSTNETERSKAFSTSPLPSGEGSGVGLPRFIIAESGIRDYRDFQVVRKADGFLIGTGLMRSSADFPVRKDNPSEQADWKDRPTFSEHFQSKGKFLFKACGIRTPETWAALSDGVTPSHPVTNIDQPDFIGINFSPVSKRRIAPGTFQVFKTWKVSSDAVAVFYKNTESEIREILEQYPFRAVQLYAGDVTPEFVRSLKQRVLLAVRVSDQLNWSETMARYVEPYAADVDFFILDGATPGSGQRIGAAIPADFPYPFLLAGGLHEENVEAVLEYENCIGVDVASGIETDGQVDWKKIRVIATRLSALHPGLGHGAFCE